MVKMNEDKRLLEHKHKVDAERKAAAIARRRQQDLRDTTPGVATPSSIARFLPKRGA